MNRYLAWQRSGRGDWYGLLWRWGREAPPRATAAARGIVLCAPVRRSSGGGICCGRVHRHRRAVVPLFGRTVQGAARAVLETCAEARIWRRGAASTGSCRWAGVPRLYRSRGGVPDLHLTASVPRPLADPRYGQGRYVKAIHPPRSRAEAAARLFFATKACSSGQPTIWVRARSAPDRHPDICYLPPLRSMPNARFHPQRLCAGPGDGHERSLSHAPSSDLQIYRPTPRNIGLRHARVRDGIVTWCGYPPFLRLPMTRGSTEPLVSTGLRRRGPVGEPAD